MNPDRFWMSPEIMRGRAKNKKNHTSSEEITTISYHQEEISKQRTARFLTVLLVSSVINPIALSQTVPRPITITPRAPVTRQPSQLPPSQRPGSMSFQVPGQSRSNFPSTKETVIDKVKKFFGITLIGASTNQDLQSLLRYKHCYSDPSILNIHNRLTNLTDSLNRYGCNSTFNYESVYKKRLVVNNVLTEASKSYASYRVFMNSEFKLIEAGAGEDRRGEVRPASRINGQIYSSNVAGNGKGLLISVHPDEKTSYGVIRGIFDFAPMNWANPFEIYLFHFDTDHKLTSYRKGATIALTTLTPASSLKVYKYSHGKTVPIQGNYVVKTSGRGSLTAVIHVKDVNGLILAGSY